DYFGQHTYRPRNRATAANEWIDARGAAVTPMMFPFTRKKHARRCSASPRIRRRGGATAFGDAGWAGFGLLGHLESRRDQPQGGGFGATGVVDRLRQDAGGFLIGVESHRVLTADEVQPPHARPLPLANLLELLLGRTGSLGQQ